MQAVNSFDFVPLTNRNWQLANHLQTIDDVITAHHGTSHVKSAPRYIGLATIITHLAMFACDASNAINKVSYPTNFNQRQKQQVSSE